MDLNELAASIKEHEGLRLIPYTDTVGKTTIGYGRNLTDRGISFAEANFLLENDINDAICFAQKELWWPRVANDDVRARALVEIIFNVGISSFHKFYRAVSALERGTFKEAANEFMDSKWAGQVGGRAAVLCKMIEAGSL